MAVETVLISGAGIAGPALAFWLKAAGFEPTIIERAPRLRTGGYVIDFWGLGYDIAERMGLASDLDRLGYHLREMRIVDARGRRAAGFGTKVFRELTAGRFVTLLRSDLSRILMQKVEGTSEVIFGDEIAALREREDAVEVEFRHAKARRFDLVIGADGHHSSVRRLVFGPAEQFEARLGYMVAAFEVQGYRPREPDTYVIYNEPGRMLGRCALRDDRTFFLFVFTSDTDTSPDALDFAAQKALLRHAFGAMNWECPRILAELDRTESLYIDRVSQIRMPGWSRGRVALTGDAAFCPSLMAGQGSALAITSAYVLAGELAAARGQYEAAFGKYEQTLRAWIDAKQQGAARFAAAFAPATRRGIFIRNQIMKLFAIPGLARLTFGRDIVDALPLPPYPWLSAETAAVSAPEIDQGGKVNAS